MRIYELYLTDSVKRVFLGKFLEESFEKAVKKAKATHKTTLERLSLKQQWEICDKLNNRIFIR